jgi:hypothetical protein
MTRTDFIEAIRRWIDTPVAHQGRILGKAADCGFIAEVGKSLGVEVPLPNYSEEASFIEVESFLDNTMQRTSLPLAGDIALLHIDTPKGIMLPHLAVLSSYPFGGLALIHAWKPAGKVCEHRLDDRWSKRISHVYTLPGVA